VSASIDLSQYIGDIARRLLGSPNPEHSTREQLRFGTNGSIAVEISGPDAGTWYDHEHKRGGGALQLLTLEGGMLPAAAREWLKSELGIELEESKPKARQQVVATYDYVDESEKLLHQAVRKGPVKRFHQRAPDGNGGWKVGPDGKWTIKGVRIVPYRLPELIAATPETTIYIPEGEKDVDNLRAIDCIGTCNPMGAGKWRTEFAEHFHGNNVVILPDNDETGRDHALDVAANLAPVAACVRILELPGLPEKGDVSDWLAAGGTREQLEQLAAASPAFDPNMARPRMAAKAPALPNDIGDTEESIRAAINALTNGDRPGTQSVIERISAARLPPMIVDDLLDIIKQKTHLKTKVLDQTLSQTRRSRGQSGSGDDKESQATELVGLAIQSHAEFFHNRAGDGFATITIDGHKETWSLRSKALRGWLTKIFYDKTAAAPNSESLGAAINVLEAMARFDGKEIPVCLRVGEYEGKYYLDMCDANWRAVEIDADGWRIVNNPPVRFRRTGGMLPLPEPQRGGDIAELHRLLNVRDKNSFTLAVGFLLGALNPNGPYAVLGLGGEHGAAKTSFARTIKDLVDPHSLPPRALPREERDLFIAAINGWILAFDNMSGMPDWLSDNFCQLSTGGGFSTRQLYTDGEEVLFEAKRPVILNGIEDFITRADLADRSLLLTLKRIDERLTEGEVRARFTKLHPGILGALLDAVSHGLKHQHETKLDRLPRMADFALWVTACEGALWVTGTFINAYEANRAEATETVLDADSVAVAVRKFMRTNKGWEGTATELLSGLAYITPEAERHERKWPKAGNALSGRLRRAAPSLREFGIDIQFDSKGDADNTKIIKIDKIVRKIVRSSEDRPRKMPWGLAVSDDRTIQTVFSSDLGHLSAHLPNGGEGGDEGEIGARASGPLGEGKRSSEPSDRPKSTLPPGIWIDANGFTRDARGWLDFNNYDVQGTA
jgi:hypothetical protein